MKNEIFQVSGEVKKFNFILYFPFQPDDFIIVYAIIKNIVEVFINGGI